MTSPSAPNGKILKAKPVNLIHQHEHEDAALARRVLLVDKLGEAIDTSNPVPVVLTDGSINIDTIDAQIAVALSHLDGNPDSGDVADSVRIGDGTYELKVNSDGSINVRLARVTTPNIENINIPSANTEQSFTFPTETARYRFKIRDGKAKARISYVSGESGTNFWTVERGAFYEENEVDASGGLTIYFQTTHGNVVAEIQYWEN